MRDLVRVSCLLVVGLSLASGRAHAATQRIRLAVMGLANNGTSEALARNLTDVVTVALNKLGVFDVLSRADMQQMLAFERDKQLVGCASDTDCLAELGGALGVAMLVTGSIGKVGGDYLLSLTLTDTKRARVRSREQRTVSREKDLTAAAEAAARFLVRELLARQQGSLVVRCSESNADVAIDGRIVGATPIGQVALGGGPHTLRVTKQGFVSWVRDIEIHKDEPTVVDVTLVPSVEFIASYDRRARLWRSSAYVSGGIGIAALAFGVGGWVWNGRRNDAYERELVAANCQEGAPLPPSKDCTTFERRYDSIIRFDRWTQLAVAGGVLALATSATLWTVGPPPGAYDAYKRATTARVDLVPTRGGTLAALRGAF